MITDECEKTDNDRVSLSSVNNASQQNQVPKENFQNEKKKDFLVNLSPNKVFLS
jgi:hypothetical protein